MSGVISRNLKNISISNSFPDVHKRGIHAHTDAHTDTRTQTHRQTYTHDDRIRRNAMRCISPNNCCWLSQRVVQKSSVVYFTASLPKLRTVCRHMSRRRINNGNFRKNLKSYIFRLLNCKSICCLVFRIHKCIRCVIQFQPN